VMGVAWKSLKLIGVCVYGGCLYHVITTYVIDLARFKDKSMYPTINKTSGDDRIIVRMYSIRRRHYFKKDDIVVLIQPDNPNQLICKRITHIEGETIPPCNDRNGFIYNQFKSLNIVPRGHVWVEGDNSSLSYDSRHFGPVPMSLIKCTVLLRVWPVSQFGRVT
jgi:inner membrane protease subunit 1